MIRFYKFRQDLLGPQPARELYRKPGPGRGWPEECPPIRAASAFGFDLPAEFDVTFAYDGDQWSAAPERELSSDFDWSPSDDVRGRPLAQRYAWFWDKGQILPHPIDDHVYAEVKHQVKVSTFTYLATDANELLLFTDVPNVKRPFRAVAALVDADWYPASYPWHVVLELDPAASPIAIRQGDPLARLIPVRRDAYFARPMSVGEFDDFFERGQRWLQAHGKPHEGAEEGQRDVTRTYVKQQLRSRFVVME